MTDLLSLYIESVFSSCSTGSFSLKEELISEHLRSHHPHLTEEKIKQVHAMYRECWSHHPDDSRQTDFFYTIIQFAKEKVLLRGNQVRVKLEELLRWRRLAEIIGEDTLVTAWLAYHFRWTEMKISDAEWNMACAVEDPDMNYLYDKGLTDLHHHLKASTDVFTLSWVCLMNHITHRYRVFREIGARQMYPSCFEAARIRYLLWSFLNGSETTPESFIGQGTEEYLLERKMQELQDRMAYARMLKGKNALYDYAVPSFSTTHDQDPNVFEGERWLLYTTLRQIFRESVHKDKLSKLLFRYLMIKHQLRRRMVQINANVGFSNFSIYERRKDLFLEGHKEYEELLITLPISEGGFHHLKYLETRIAPKSNYQNLKQSSKQILASWKKKKNGGIDTKLIFHFIKKDDEKWNPHRERHHKLRLDLRRQAITMMTLRRRFYALYDIFVGIDAANTELDCRPEVFAHAFRYVKAHNDDNIPLADAQKRKRVPISLTYHVGEDFYDIVDGLRAIDEAIRFLGISTGDRLGHCIALGIDPENYYKKYDYKVIAKKQYIIDNIVWMLHQIQCASIEVPASLMVTLKEKYRTLIYDLYEKDIDMEIYRLSMLLRGDEPRDASRSMPGLPLKDWNSCALTYDVNLNSIRKNKEAQQLYHRYHFDKKVREEGEKMEVLKVDEIYANCVRQIQDFMMKQLGQASIAIECCPSSNLKIGLSDRYENQPIFRFFPIEIPQKRIPVTINTDDLGIFQTSVDNECSLLLLAAMKVKDKEGNRRFSKTEVIQWLEMIVQNGHKYKFS